MKALIFILFIFAAAYMLGNWLKHKPLASNVDYSDCDITRQACRHEINGGHYEVYFSAQPSPLVPFDVIVMFGELQPDAVSVSFEMENMDMGFNEHPLIQNDQAWTASVILPVCSLGRSDWKVKLAYSLDGRNHVTEYRFQQN